MWGRHLNESPCQSASLWGLSTATLPYTGGSLDGIPTLGMMQTLCRAPLSLSLSLSLPPPPPPVATQLCDTAVGCCGRGYHSDDGRLYAGSGVGADFGPGFGEGDTVGCGVFQAENDDLCFFFTKNGVLLGGTPAAIGTVLSGSGILGSAYSTERSPVSLAAHLRVI